MSIKFCFYFLLYCPSEPCCFDVKNVFLQSKMGAIKTLTDTSRISRILHAHCYQYTNQPYLRTTGQPNSISMPDDNFKYLAMQLAKVWGQCTFLLHTKLARVNPNLLTEKNIPLRHTYLKATAFSVAFDKSRSTRISLLTVFVAVRDLYSFVWVTLGVFLNLSLITDSAFLSS